jgi:hypothetical protein
MKVTVKGPPFGPLTLTLPAPMVDRLPNALRTWAAVGETPVVNVIGVVVV